MKNNREPEVITIHQVAREAGVSTATVSRVMNKSNSVSPDLQVRVM
ncbi:MAG TPA: LacI family DNA-binding transcriptional regulator, partial [Paludibacteraceae bacterium]|nr:LacI family DNA-binding transcriptional regulator [Paludibacteraceae bacterium]